jgi:hypothetical protein
MSRSLNVRAKDFALRHLFLADPDEGYMTASIAVRELARLFCESEDCNVLCRKHAQAMLLGVSKMVVAGEVLAEVSTRGVVFVRLSPVGVLSPESWASVPDWFYLRPDLVGWARGREVAV